MIGAEAILLGTAQDAGLPQAGCQCFRCSHARLEPESRKFPVSLGLVDHVSASFWIIDATPAFGPQLDYVLNRFPGYSMKGIFLTHAHMGHYSGLIQLGKEAWNVSEMPLYASRAMIRFLSENEPWSQIILQNLKPIEIRPGQNIQLGEGLQVRPVVVPHRAEYTDTLAFNIRGLEGALFYCPDIDSFEGFNLEAALGSTADALLDGTFYSEEELPGRDIRLIPHPMVVETISMLTGLSSRVWFIHLNHTNPLNDDSPERDLVEKSGAGVARQWQSWPLS